MKKLILTIAVLFICGISYADTYIRGYYRDNGTYVQPHYRTNPDGNPYNNYSSYGNTNPYTGQTGYTRPDYTNYQTLPKYNYGGNNRGQGQSTNPYYGF